MIGKNRLADKIVAFGGLGLFLRKCASTYRKEAVEREASHAFSRRLAGAPRVAGTDTLIERVVTPRLAQTRLS